MRKGVNILRVMGYPFKQYGSLERYLVCLSKECRKKGYNLFIHFDSDLMPYDGQYIRDIYEAGGEIVGFKMNRKYDLSYSFKMINLIKKKDISIVHSYFSPACHVASWAAWICRVKAIFRTIGSMPYVHEYRSKLFAVVRQHLFAFPLKKTIVVCEAIKEAYTSYFGIDAGKVLVIYGGTDLDRFRPTFNSSELKFRKDLKISENDKILGVIADLEPRKGHQYLLEAMPRIIEEVPNVKLLLIGNGSLKNKLQELCKELKIENHTIFVGTRNDIEKIIHLIDVSILPSLCGEGLSASLLESMAAEKPVVATDVGGTYELLEHGKNGFLVPPRDSSALAKAIITIIKNRKLAAEMGFEGRKVVKQNFDITIRAKREIELYEKFLANPL